MTLTDGSEILKAKAQQLREESLPRHVAMIMDGNGRWAKRRGLDRSLGHSEGVKSVRKATELSSQLGIGYLTLYTFSVENWNRPKEEVDALMHLVSIVIEQEVPDLIANNVRLNLIGDIDMMPREARERLLSGVRDTSHCTGLTLSLAMSYSARREIANAAREIARQAREGKLSPDDIDEQSITRFLYTKDIPDPDLLIRTGGEYRISNYLLWQIAYSELYFTDILWPDFGKEQYLDALLDYQSRERRFGKTSEQVK